MGPQTHVLRLQMKGGGLLRADGVWVRQDDRGDGGQEPAASPCVTRRAPAVVDGVSAAR